MVNYIIKYIDMTSKIRDAEISSILVQLSTKVKSLGTQIVKIKDKYYKIKELG